MAEAAALVSHNGHPVPPWTETAKEFLIMQKFPHLRKRLEDGLHCLSRSERVQLELVSSRGRLSTRSGTQDKRCFPPACRSEEVGGRGQLDPLRTIARASLPPGGRQSGTRVL